MSAPRITSAAAALTFLLLAGCPRPPDRPDAGQPPCVPLTCAGEGKDCGEIDDGCGGRVACGTCTDGLSCGAAGPNLCGGPCRAGCPRGFTCDARGQCAGGDAGELRIELQAFTASGRITRDGGTPGSCTAAQFVNDAGEVKATIGADCATGDFSGLVYPGTYRLEGTGLASGNVLGMVPLGFLADPALAVAADVSGLAIDMGTVDVTGQIMVNGVNASGAAQVIFVDVARGQEIGINADAVSGTYFARLYPGTYRVAVKGISGSQIPGTRYTVSPATVISGDLSLPLDLPAVPFSGRVTINGATFTPNAQCNSFSGVGHVELRDAAQGYYFRVVTSCVDASFSAPVYPGTYRVDVSRTLVTSPGGDIPEGILTVQPSLTIPSSGVTGHPINVPVLTVSGQVTREGAPLTPASDCSDQVNGAAHVFLTGGQSLTGLVRHFTPVKCQDSTYSLQVLTGIYRVEVAGIAANLPKQSVPFPDLTLSADRTDLVLDVSAAQARTVAIAGRVLRDGVPARPINCRAGYGTAGVTFHHVDGTKIELTAGCASSYFSASLRVGVYVVTVQGRDSDLPTGVYEMPRAMNIAAATASLDMDVPATIVSGSVTLNGRPPLPNVLCGGQGIGAADLSFFTPRGDSYQAVVDCASGAFSLPLFPGPYQVRIFGRQSDVPWTDHEVITRLAVP